MKRIDAFVDRVYRNVEGNPNEVQELKDEMKNHLYELVKEEMEQGKTENEAILCALERFGDEEDTAEVVVQLFTRKKIFAKRWLQFSFTVMLLGALLFGAIVGYDGYVNKKVQAIWTDTVAMLDEQPKSIFTVEQEEELRQQLENEIPFLKSFQISYLNEVKHNWKDEELIFLFEQEGFFGKLPGVEILQGKSTSTYKKYSEEEYEIVEPWTVVYERISMEMWAVYVLFIGFPLYWIGFAIWATLQAREEKRLNLAWGVLFFLLNIIGYTLYIAMGKIQRFYATGSKVEDVNSL